MVQFLLPQFFALLYTANCILNKRPRRRLAVQIKQIQKAVTHCLIKMDLTRAAIRSTSVIIIFLFSSLFVCFTSDISLHSEDITHENWETIWRWFFFFDAPVW